MKHTFFTLLALLTLVVSLTACGDSTPQNTSSQSPPNSSSLQPSVPATPAQPADLTGFSLYHTIKYEEGSPERALGFLSLELYTDAETDKNGGFMWDDGQNFLLAARTGEEALTVFPKTYFQLTQPDICSFLSAEGQLTILVESTQGGAGFTLAEYRFDPATKSFSEETAYEVQNINYFRR